VPRRSFKREINAFYRKEKEGRQVPLVRTYKRVGNVALDAFVFVPEDVRPGERRPAMVYLHGGSWSEGKPDWHFGASEYGFVNVAVEYRTPADTACCHSRRLPTPGQLSAGCGSTPPNCTLTPTKLWRRATRPAAIWPCAPP
jgi:hypothetical protein